MKLRFLKRAERPLQLQQDWWAEHAGAADVLETEVQRVVAMLRTKHILFYRVNEKAGVIEGASGT